MHIVSLISTYCDSLRCFSIFGGFVKQVSNIFSPLLCVFASIQRQMFDRGVSNICYRHHLNQAYHDRVTPRNRVPACRTDIR